jgi:signal transduction histidine kinase
MAEFARDLYDALLYGLGKTLSRYDPGSAHILVCEMGANIRRYLEGLGYTFPPEGDTPEEAAEGVVRFFIEHGFVKLERAEWEGGCLHAVWKDLLGLPAYERLYREGGDTFISCPMNAIILDALARFGKALRLRAKDFRPAERRLETWEEIAEEAEAESPPSGPVSLETEQILRLEREKARRLEQANRELARTNQAKTRMVASLSHELRTPLQAILGFTELLLEEVGPDQPARPLLENIRTSAEHLVNLVANALDLSRLEEGRLVLHTLDDVEVGDLLRRALHTLTPLAHKREIHLEQDIPAGLKARLDPLRIFQVVLNLLANAVKFTPAGGRAGVRARQEGGVLVIEVWDTGPGIPEADRERIFRPYEQGAEAREGSGLGLPIAQHLVRLHGGRLELESVLGQGSTFRALLPVSGRPETSAEVTAGALP